MVLKEEPGKTSKQTKVLQSLNSRGDDPVKLVLAALLLAFSIPAVAQQSQPSPPYVREGSLLDHMTGHWVMRGVVAGQPTVHDVDADWVLNREYLRLHEISRERSPKGDPAYEAIVFVGWDAAAHEYTLLWLDTTSGAGLNSPVIGRGKLSGNQIAFLFKSHEGNFHTTFAYDPSSDTWRWIMDGEENGKWSPFARLKLTRKHE